MARGEGTDDGAELLEVGRERRRVRTPSWSRLIPLSAAGVVAVVGMAQAARVGPSPARAPAPAAATAPSSSGGSVPPVAVTDVGHPILYAGTGWELFGRGAGEVVRIEMARGRITRTAVPALLSGAPVSFVVTADRAMVRSIDRVPGYVVPDGQPARAVPPTLSDGGRVFPGPDPGTVWVESGDGAHSAMVLRGVSGGPDRASIAVPEQDPVLDMTSDGAGYLVFRATGGYYHATPAGLRRITSGSLLATGRTRWLALECDDHHRCRSVAINRTTGARRIVRAALRTNAPPGVIAPDGRTAAMFSVGDAGTVAPYLLDLGSGTSRPIDPPIQEGIGDRTLVWSPDSRWLFLAASDGAIWSVNRATARGGMLGVSLAPPAQLAVRPGGP